MNFTSLLKLLNLLVIFVDAWRSETKREEGREEVRTEVAAEEATTKEATDAVMAEDRTAADTAGRLRDGTF